MSDKLIVLSFGFDTSEQDLGIISAETAIKFEISHDSLSLKEFLLGFGGQINKELSEKGIALALAKPASTDLIHYTVARADNCEDAYEVFEAAEDAIMRALGEAGFNLHRFHRATVEEFDGTNKFFKHIAPNIVDKTLN